MDKFVSENLSLGNRTGGSSPRMPNKAEIAGIPTADNFFRNIGTE